MAVTSQDQQAIVAAHNAYRSDPAINTPALQWSSDLAAGAQSWADNLATNIHHLQHSDFSVRAGLGENIAQASKGSNTAAHMVDFWGKTRTDAKKEKPAEQENYKPGVFPDTSKTGNWADAGHYTQVIWRTTTSVGCGIASDGTNDYLVCRYSEAGNMSGVQLPDGLVLPFSDQDVITLVADNGRYVTRLTSSDPNWNPIEASVQYAQPDTDPKSQFTVSILPSGKITFKTDSGLFWGRVNRRAGLDPIEAAKTSSADIYAQFTVKVLPNNQIALQADSGLFLSRVERTGGAQQPIEACKTSIDAQCTFTVAMAPSPV